MHSWLSSRLDRQPSHRNTLIAIITFAILAYIFLQVFDGAAIYFGYARPRLQSFLTISLSVVSVVAMLLFVGPPRLPVAKPFSVPALLLLAIVLCAVIGYFSFASYAWSADEYAYLFEADTFRSLRLWNTPPPLGIESTTYVWIKDGKWVAQYPPGWPLILALFGGSFPTGRLAGGFCIAVAAYSVYELVKARANRESAWLTLMFFVLTPFVLFNGGSILSHSSAAALTALTMLVSHKAKHSQRLWLLVALGACIGMLGMTRNVAAVAVIIAVVIDQFSAGKLVTRGALIALGGAPFLAGLMAYQYSITGHATMPVYWYAGRTVDHLYFDWESIQAGLRHTALGQPELALFTSPVILLLWLSAIWKVVKTKSFAASDLVMPLGMLIFVFYPLYPGHRAGPRYYFDFWPLAVVTIGAALPHFKFMWRNLYAGAMAVSIVYAGTMTAFLVFEMRYIIQNRFAIYEVAKSSGVNHAVVCANVRDPLDSVTGNIDPVDVARNGVDIGDPQKAAQKDFIFVDCRKTSIASIKTAYPNRSVWLYKWGVGKQPGKLVPITTDQQISLK